MSNTTMHEYDINSVIEFLNSVSDMDILSFIGHDVPSRKELVMKLRRKDKEEKVLKKHINGSGQPRRIKQRSDGIYVALCANRKNIYAKDYDTLIDKLYKHYYEDDIKERVFSFDDAFEYTLKIKQLERNNSDITLERNRQTYNTYFKDYFSKVKDIAELDADDIRLFLRTTLINNSIKPKELDNIFTVLNSIFRILYRKQILIMNPMYEIEKITYSKLCNHSAQAVTCGQIQAKCFSEEEIKTIQNACRERINSSKYDVYSYAIIFSSLTGVRVSEIPAIKWSDVQANALWIHSMQLDKRTSKNKCKGEYTRWVFAPFTKNEKGIPQGGRLFPLLNDIKELLDEIKNVQQEQKIESEYIFVKADGNNINIDGYRSALARLCKKLGLSLTNNHSFRKAVNMRLVEAGINPAIRSQMLGHSVKTNLSNYTVTSNDWIETTLHALGSLLTPTDTQNIIQFPGQKNSPNTDEISVRTI